jgi:hypothetical protein
VRRVALILAAALALVLFSTGATSVQADSTFTPTGAVTLKVDHAAKTITATVKLAFYRRGCGPGVSCEPPAADVARIVRAIESNWNTGQKVKCYTFSVVVDARTAGSQAEAGQNEVDVGLDYGPVPVRAFVHGEYNVATASDPLSSSPDNRIDPVHDPASPTTWPSNTYDRTYAHEFGHILGLDDNYDPARPGFPVAGTSDDLMFRKQGEVTGEMVTRVVERSGQVELNDLECGWTVNADTPLGTVRGKHCDGLGGEWTINGDEKLLSRGTVTSLWNVTIDPTTLAGTFRHEKIQDIKPTITTSNQKGAAHIAKGQDGRVTMTLDAGPIRMKTTTPFGSGAVTVEGEEQEFIWEPDDGTACP